MKQFTNLYQLSKTLIFELQPVGKTKDTFKQWLEEMKKTERVVDNDDNLFLKDKKIKEAYLTIKPIMDRLHEQFIEMSLLSEEAKQIDFSEYFEAYQTKSVSEKLENVLREKIGDTYKVAGKCLSEEISNVLGKEFKTKRDKPYECLTDAKMYYYLSAKAKDLAKQNGLDEQTLAMHILQFKGFWGYLTGYNKNRENYYEIKKEATTAVATRIIHENLPTFCSNIIRFEKRKEEYLNIYQHLKDNYRETKIKNSQGREVDVEAIIEDVFQIKHFNECLAQSQIEEYNRVIGNYNMLINLHNQLRRTETDFKKIDEFETLYKQIGCGKKQTMFEILQDDNDVKKLLHKASETGKEMFNANINSHEIKTVPDFITFLKECDNWDGIYMSKAAISKISNLYFANWHSIKDKLKEAKANACITYDKKREDPIKLRDAVELSGLFVVLDTEQSEHFFKDSLFKDDKTNEYRGVLNKALTPSKNLINLLCYDIERNINLFLDNLNKIVAKEKYKGENIQKDEDETIKQIKEWFDAATNAMRIIRYFSVRKSKMKGNMPNVSMEQALSNLLYNDDAQWFKWYDLIRNYLTKKPQDDVKEKKLKLNFGTSSLLGGWSDGQEKNKAATLLKNNGEMYLCILRKKDIFDTSKDDNPMYKTGESNASRLILRNLGFKTLAGKGFLGEYGVSYGEMGKNDPSKAIHCLQKIIKERYVIKYPLLEKFVVNTYTDKTKFDAEISETLKECYVCEFIPIDWNVVTEKQNNKELFLFKINCKDYKPQASGKKDLQTIYWEDVLTDGSKHQLCAGAEIFMREPVAKESPIKHSVGSKLVNRRDKDGKTIPEQIYREIYLKANDETKKISVEAQKYIDAHKVTIKDVKHEIIKDKRFYGEEPKYIFHCPIKLYYEAKDPKYAFSEVNAKIINSLQQSKNLQFIGIDRGEKHLVYSCTIDKDCKIIKCNHHDTINGTDYVQKLEALSDERIIAKKNWQEQNKIKDLKSGYISHVVRCLVEETIKDGDIISPHAYIVLEDLSVEMKRGRQKFEKQVYQNLETALARKLNFVVDKDAKQGDLGSVSKALQLTPPINNYQDIEGKKQFGIMLYTRANYTSVTDPATGWRKTIYIKDGKEEDIKKQILDNFSDIGFVGQDYYFEYTEANAGRTWRMYSGKNGEPLPRYRNKKQMIEDKNIWVAEKINVVEILDILFANFNKSESFKKQIEEGVELKKDDRRDETAWQSLRFAIDMIQQIRNSGEKNSKDDNFLYSPVRKNGKHFDTRNYEDNGELSEIRDADANGAYNIARKGLIMDAHIKYWIEKGRPMISRKKDEKIYDLDLFVSDKEWDLWLLDRGKWEEELPIFASRSAKDNDENIKTAKRIKKN